MPKKLKIEEFIERSNKIHKNKYIYTKTDYINSYSKIIITCPIHGDFIQRASDHLNSKCGCIECDPTKSLGTNLFITRSNIKHNNRYAYNFVIYGKNNYDKVTITCKSHGNFNQTPFAHLNGQGCPLCVNNRKMTTEEFIQKSISIHDIKYDYSTVEYKSNKSKVDIICPIHGSFSQRASLHLEGFGCKQCKSSKGEKEIAKLLDIIGIFYEVEKRFNDCRNVYPLPFDFWLPDFKTCIEYDGIQHRKSIDYFGGEDRLKYTKINDNIKSKYCEDNNINLIRINNIKELEEIYNLIINKDSIINHCNRNKMIELSKLSLDNNKNRCISKKSNSLYLIPSVFDIGYFIKFKNELNNFIKKSYSGKIILDDNLNGFNLDVFIPDLGIAFKLLGLFSHCEINVPKKYNQDLQSSMSESGYKIIQIYEDSWYNKSEIIKSRILNLLNKSEIIYARNCIVKEIKTNQSSEFIEKCHMQGNIGSSVKIGLFHNDVLVSVMTFGSLRKNLGQKSSIGDYELLRFCNILNTNVIGSASKMFKFFIKNYNPNSIISYADKCWSNKLNNVYKSIGLKFIHESNPSYFYIIGNKRKGRFGYRKDQLLLCGYDKSWTEHTIMLANNIYRIYDCGSFKFQWVK
jgi:hypothetical protein